MKCNGTNWVYVGQPGISENYSDDTLIVLILRECFMLLIIIDIQIIQVFIIPKL